jgi:hypothetical protein
VWVPGRARTKGSLYVRGRRANGTAILAEQVAGSGEWRATVAEVVLRALGARFEPGGPVLAHTPSSEPVMAALAVYLPRPRGRADAYPARRTDGDLDKLQRNVGDALVDAGVLVDDGQIVRWEASKAWAPSPEHAGVWLLVRAMTPAQGA